LGIIAKIYPKSIVFYFDIVYNISIGKNNIYAVRQVSIHINEFI